MPASNGEASGLRQAREAPDAEPAQSLRRGESNDCHTQCTAGLPLAWTLEVSTIREILKVTEMPSNLLRRRTAGAGALSHQAMARAFYQVLPRMDICASVLDDRGFCPLRSGSQRMGGGASAPLPQEIRSRAVLSRASTWWPRCSSIAATRSSLRGRPTSQQYRPSHSSRLAS